MENSDSYTSENYIKRENIKNKINIINANKIKNIIIVGGLTLITSLCFEEINKNNVNVMTISDVCISSIVTTTSYVFTLENNYKLNKEKEQIKKLLKLLEYDR